MLEEKRAGNGYFFYEDLNEKELKMAISHHAMIVGERDDSWEWEEPDPVEFQFWVREPYGMETRIRGGDPKVKFVVCRTDNDKHNRHDSKAILCYSREEAEETMLRLIKRTL